MLEINQLYDSLEKFNTFKGKGVINNITYFEFEHMDITYAYDIYSKNGKVIVDFLIRDKFFVKKIKEFIHFDKNNKIYNVVSDDNLKNVLDGIIKYDFSLKKLIDNIFKINVSVVITNYNRENIINTCLTSLKNQKNEEVTYEVIIVDDNSTDNSFSVIENFIKDNKISNFKLYKRHYNSGGPSLPRNDGIELSSGEYIYIIDSDDSLNEFAIRDGYRHSKSNNSDICLLKKVAKNRSAYASRVFNSGTTGKADFFENKLFYNPQAHCFFKNVFLKRHKILFNVEHNIIEDLIFISECFSKTDKISILSEKDYYYISEITGDNISLYGAGGIQKSFSAFMTCLSYYLISRDSKKYSCFLNILFEFIEPWWLNGKATNNEKIMIIDSFSTMLDERLVDFKYILPRNLKGYLNVKERKYSEYLVFK